MNELCREIAYTMFQSLPGRQGQALPPSLVERLDTAERLCRACGGMVLSRQVVAVIIEQWNRDTGGL